jgi:hypothetical protein
MRILLDENIPFGLRKLLGDHDVKHASEEGWDGLTNGRLIAAAEAAGHDVSGSEPPLSAEHDGPRARHHSNAVVMPSERTYSTPTLPPFAGGSP